MLRPEISPLKYASGPYKDGPWRKVQQVKSATEEENSLHYSLGAKLRKKKDTEEVIYNIKRNSEIQTQRIQKKKSKVPGMN